MGRFQRQTRRRVRVGLVSYYLHHGSWYLYYRQGGRQIRQRVAGDEQAAAVAATHKNAQFLGVPFVSTGPASSPPADVTTRTDFRPVTVAELRAAFLEHHEHVLQSSMATVARYRTATKYLDAYATNGTTLVHEVVAESFLRHLRTRRVAPNGHPHSERRPLHDKGIRFILEVARAMYRFAAKRRHLPPYAENPFSELTTKRLRVENAKTIFVFDDRTELAFLAAADKWAFPIHLTLAKTGMRPGELTHLLVEDLDLDGGWVHVRNKPELGWRIKTGRDRRIPLVHEVVSVLQQAIGERLTGLVFRRAKFSPESTALSTANRKALAVSLQRMTQSMERSQGQPLSRYDEAQAARRLWHKAGMVKSDAIRKSFIRIAVLAGLSDATCPKSWRHTYATLLQDANVDPLLRQITLGHSPPRSAASGLGMSGVYSHSRPQTQRSEIERAMRLWPNSLRLGAERASLPQRFD